MTYPGQALNTLLEEADPLWGNYDLQNGDPSIVHKALSQVIAIVPEDAVQYVTLTFDKENEAKFQMHVFALNLLLRVTSEGTAENTVETAITPRARLSTLCLLSAPVTTSSSSGSGGPLTIELGYPGETLTLTNRGVSSPAQRGRLNALLPSLLNDLLAHS